jgi:phosphoglycerate kinase
MHGQRVIYVRDWFDEDAVVVTGELREAIARATVGDIVLLENTRKYDFETALWDFDLSTRRFDAERLHAITASFASVVRNYMFDALAASNPDWSSVVVPAYMDRVAISEQIIEEFRSHVIPARKAEALVFSGLKMDKLVDLDAILREGRVRLLIIGGALAMPFRRALTNHDGLRRGIGLAESATEQSKPYYVKNQDVRLAQQILRKAHEKEVEVVLPEDFILDNGDVASDIPEGRLQMDIGPESARKFEAHLIDFVRSTPGCVVFYNGVMGKFEDARFAAGTRRLIASLRKITEDGARTYVGGGEGLLALERYGDKSWVTHAFTAGGTILKAMSGRVIGYLSALARYERLHVTEEETRWST